MSYLITSKQHLSAVSGGGAPSDDKPQTCTVPPPPQPTPAPYVPKTDIYIGGQTNHTAGGGTQSSLSGGIKTDVTPSIKLDMGVKLHNNGNYSGEILATFQM